MNFGELLDIKALDRNGYIRVAYVIYICFPQSDVSIAAEGSDFVITFTYKGEPLIEVNKEGVKLLDIARNMKFSGIIEGSIETMAGVSLRHIASRGIQVLKPEYEYSFTQIKPDYKQIQLNKCNKCGQSTGIRRIYVGEQNNEKFDENYYFYGGKHRNKDLGWFVCIKCQSEFTAI